MNRLHELFSIALDVFNLATSRGFYFLPFLFAIAYLILSDDEKHKRTITFLLAPTALGMLILLSPFVGSYAEGRDYIQICRFYWTLPFDLIVAYCIADSLWKAKRPATKAALIAVLALGVMSSTRQYNTILPKVDIGWPWEVAANLYKVPASVEKTCDIILTEQNGKACRAAFPHDLAMYVRQYDATIMMPYGSYVEWRNSESPCFGPINTDQINLDEVEQVALEDGLDYFVLDQSKIVSGSLVNYAEIDSVPDGETSYSVYKRIFTVA